MSGQPSYLGVVTAGWVAALKSSDSLERRLAAHAPAEIGHTVREAIPAERIAKPPAIVQHRAYTFSFG